MTTFIFLTISFLASTVGAICGIGGGVIIKPVLDAFGGLERFDHQFSFRLYGSCHVHLFCS